MPDTPCDGLAVTPRAPGRMERSLFALDRLQNADPRRRVPAVFNEGEARNALARNRLGGMRDQSFANRHSRVSRLNLATEAIVLGNTGPLERAVRALREHVR